jgi:hypothetical protein
LHSLPVVLQFASFAFQRPAESEELSLSNAGQQ